MSTTTPTAADSAPAPGSAPLFAGARVVLSKELPDRSRLSRLLVRHGAMLLPVADMAAAHPLTHYVLDTFQGELFQDLKRRASVHVIGAQAVLDSIRLLKPLPRAPHPVFCRTLENWCITSTGFTARKKAEIETLVQYMCGVYWRDLTTSITCLIAGAVGSAKYHVAVQRQLPVVSYAWLLQAWRSQTEPPLQRPYLLPPFSGLVICVTGLSLATRLHVRRLVSQYGGRYSPDLTQQCTHLLAEQPRSEKYTYAMAWGIPVVRTEWLFECVNQQAYQDITRFQLPAELALFTPPPTLTPTMAPTMAKCSPDDSETDDSERPVVGVLSPLPVRCTAATVGTFLQPGTPLPTALPAISLTSATATATATAADSDSSSPPSSSSSSSSSASPSPSSTEANSPPSPAAVWAETLGAQLRSVHQLLQQHLSPSSAALSPALRHDLFAQLQSVCDAALTVDSVCPLLADLTADESVPRAALLSGCVQFALRHWPLVRRHAACLPVAVRARLEAMFVAAANDETDNGAAALAVALDNEPPHNGAGAFARVKRRWSSDEVGAAPPAPNSTADTASRSANDAADGGAKRQRF